MVSHITRRFGMDVDVCASLPTDLLVEIFRRLDASDIIRCTFTCKPWRRAIIGNASTLRPRPDCFNPNLLLGFFHDEGGSSGVGWQRVRGPFEFALTAATTAAGDEPAETLSSFIPVDLSSYTTVLSTRDGFLLLGGGLDVNNGLCLCNPLTRECTFLPSPALVPDTYVLVTAYDNHLDDDPAHHDEQGVRIFAMKAEKVHGFLTVVISYQLLSSPNAGAATSTWGPVKRSVEFTERIWFHMFDGEHVICHGAIHWMGYLINNNRCVLSIDVGTGRTWTAEVPEQCSRRSSNCFLATSRDGQITLVNEISCGEISVWVLTDSDRRWTLRWKIHVQEFERGLSKRNKYAYSTGPDDVESQHPYEMDWSTYLSRMKHF